MCQDRPSTRELVEDAIEKAKAARLAADIERAEEVAMCQDRPSTKELVEDAIRKAKAARLALDIERAERERRRSACPRMHPKPRCSQGGRSQ